MEEKARPAHCLVFPYPMQGHINPMVQFSKRLQSKGIKVTLVTTKFMFKSLHQNSGSMALETVSDGFDEGGKASAESLEAYFARFQQVGSETLGQLIEKLGSTGCPVDCVIYDALMSWSIGVAKRYGLVGAVFFTQSCAVDIIYYHLRKGLLKVPVAGPRVSVPGLPLLEPSDLPSFIYKLGSYPATYNLVVNQFLDIEKVDWVLCNTYYKLEEEAIQWMSKQLKFRAIGPAIALKYLQDQNRTDDDTDNGLQMFEANVGPCMTWLNQRQNESVVYVSFGSVAQLDVKQMEELADGLRKSGKNFLWVVRASEEAKLPKGFVDETSEKGLVVQWCSQLEVLRHKALGCFVTHCGWNSTLEALCLGVPMVAIPIWTDQGTNAKFVADVWKMGVRIKIEEESFAGDDVANCIREVMDGEGGKEIKRNSTKWMEMAKEAVKDGGSSDQSIKEFVANLIQ